MNNEYYRKIADALQQMNEKKKLDPVDDKELKGTHAQRKDKDIDNDGDVDSSDEYLHNRRATIKKKMKASKSGKLGGHVKESADEMEECPDCDGSMDNHEADCPRAAGAKKRKLDDDLDSKSAGKAMKHDCATHVTSESWGYGECISGQHTLVEQEDGTAIVTHYDVMFEHGIEENVAVEDLTILREKSHLHASKKKVSEARIVPGFRGADGKATFKPTKKDYDSNKEYQRMKKKGAAPKIKESVFSDDKRREHEKAADHHADQAQHHTTQMNKAKSSGAHPSEYDHHKVLAKMHDRAQASHAKAVVYSRRGQHQQANSHSQIAHGHSDAVKKKASTYESTVYENRAQHMKGAHPGESRLAKFKRSYNDGMEKSKVNKMVTDLKGDNPETKLDGEAIEKEKPSSMKQSPARNGDQRKGDLKPVKQGAK